MGRKTKNSLIVISAVLALGFGSLGAVATEEGTYPKEEITIEGKKPAKFKHSTHVDMGLACGKCHHVEGRKELSQEDIAAMEDKSALKCEKCHNESMKDPKLADRKELFHAQCRECHKAGHEGKEGPTKCTDCHIKEVKKPEGC